MFLFLVMNMASSLWGMENDILVRASEPVVELLQFRGQSEEDILTMVEQLMLLELSGPARAAAPPPNESMAARLERAVESQCNPNGRLRLSRIFRLLKQNTVRPPFINDIDNVICPTSLSDLDVLIGSTTLTHSLAHRIDNTQLHIGYITLCRNLVQIKTPENLSALQNTVEQLRRSRNTGRIKSLLTEIKEIEDVFLSFWTNSDGSYDPLVAMSETQQFSNLGGLNTWANNNVFVATLGQVLGIGMQGAPTIAAGTTIIKSSSIWGVVFGAFQAIFEIKKYPERLSNISCNVTTLKLMQAKLIALRKFTDKVTELHQVLTSCGLSDEILAPLVIDFNSPKSQRLMALLQTQTFEGQPSFFSLMGKVSIAFSLMISQKDEFIDAYKGLGTIDFLVSLSQLFDTSTEAQPFCAAEYLPYDATPCIHIEDAWSVLIQAKHIQTNTISLGNENACANIITGPNARGKTTVLRTTAGASLLASTIGFGPARRIIVPAQMDFLTSINIKDEPNKSSLFQAGVKRIAAICNTLEAQFERPCLIVLDEPFTGTNTRNARVLSHGFISRLGQQLNAMMLVTSHLENIVELADRTPHLFANFHVTRGYQYVAGIDPSEDYDNVALDIVRQFMSDEYFTQDLQTELRQQPRFTPRQISAAGTFSAAAAAAAPEPAVLRQPTPLRRRSSSPEQK